MSGTEREADTARTPGLRKDAERNRLRLLAAARELFAEQGLDVTLNDIAHHAGVGVGTAYRRFANKGEVLDALFEDQVAETSALADMALADPDPWHGMVAYLEAVFELQVRDKGLAQIMTGIRMRPDQHDWSKNTLAPKVNAIAERAKQAGALRPDAEGTDLVFVQVGLNAIMNRAGHVAPELYRRYLHLMLEGLRARPDNAPLPVAALSTDDTHLAMGRPGRESAG